MAALAIVGCGEPTKEVSKEGIVIAVGNQKADSIAVPVPAPIHAIVAPAETVPVDVSEKLEFLMKFLK